MLIIEPSKSLANRLPSRSYNVSELQECAIAVDASYFLRQLLEQAENYNEPLLTALGGLTGIQARIQVELDNWLKNRTTPFFIFDGQPMVGQDEVTTKLGREIQKQTGVAWKLYSEGQAEAAVAAFGECASKSSIPWLVRFDNSLRVKVSTTSRLYIPCSKRS